MNAQPGESGASSLITALSLFTVAPVPAGEALTKQAAAAALRWFPAVGAGLGAAAGLPLAAIAHWTPRGVLIGAVLAMALLALGTRGLHLDGLADTADGLGSRAPAERALEIMRRSDIGPFGVITIVLVLLLDVVALASLPGTWTPCAALAVAAATGRLAALAGAHRRVPSARDTGFGAYVARSVTTPVLAVETAVVLAGGGVLACSVDASVPGWLVAQATALVVSTGFLAHVTRRIGGVTGDVFGALVELGTAITLAVLALAM